MASEKCRLAPGKSCFRPFCKPAPAAEDRDTTTDVSRALECVTYKLLGVFSGLLTSQLPANKNTNV